MKTVGGTRSWEQNLQQNMKGPLGEVFYIPRSDTFVKFLSVEAEPSLPDCHWHPMAYLNLKTVEEHGANLVEEIGEKLFPLPSGFTAARVEKYFTAAKEYEKAQQIMMDIDYEISLRQD